LDINGQDCSVCGVLHNQLVHPWWELKMRLLQNTQD
jgi:hypothetical protein